MHEQEWNDTERQAYKIVMACGQAQEMEDDLRQTWLVAKALMIEIEPDLIETLLKNAQEHLLAEMVWKNIH